MNEAQKILAAANKQEGNNETVAEGALKPLVDENAHAVPLKNFADVKLALNAVYRDENGKVIDAVPPPQNTEHDVFDFSKAVNYTLNKKMQQFADKFLFQLADELECDPVDLNFIGDMVWLKGEHIGELKMDMNHNEEKKAFEFTYTFVPFNK